MAWIPLYVVVNPKNHWHIIVSDGHTNHFVRDTSLVCGVSWAKIYLVFGGFSTELRAVS
jgi:hypothetical protein